jgi:hypothetical protein
VYGEKEDGEVWGRIFSSYVWKGYEKMKHGMELCVANYRGEASGLLV